MPRSPRLDTPGSFHHVMNRAVGQRPFFETREDLRHFLALLARVVRRGDLEVHAYSLLSTHFHLLVRSPRGVLSAAIGDAECKYVRAFNEKRQRPGPLVRNRFRSKRVDSLAYFANVVRYIDANAVGAGLVSRPGEYPFGSAAIYGGERTPPWLHRSTVESVTCRLASERTFSTAVYLRCFEAPPTEASRVATERSLARGDRTRLALGPIAGAHPSVRACFAQRATNADGVEMEIPVIDVDSLEGAVREAQAMVGPVIVRRGTRSTCGWTLLRIGLLHDLAGESEAEIAVRLGCGRSKVRDALARFRADLGADASTRDRLGDVLRRLPPGWSQPI